MTKPSKPVVNHGLAALIKGAGYRSLEQFAQAVNHRGWDMHGIKTAYDHVTVKRWLAGSLCQNPDVVAAVLSDGWRIPIPVEVIWPGLREGKPAEAAHRQPWVPARTLEELALFIRSDMLTRRETLSEAVKAVSGPALLAPIAAWLGAAPGRLQGTDHGVRRVGASDVEAIERSTRYFAATDAEVGGALSREAAVGQLKYAVDLAQHGSFSERTGNRLLAVIAELSGLVGWLCHDTGGMPGPAQHYFMYGLQAARESTDPRAPLLVISILADMAQQARWLGRPNAALHLHDLALRQLPENRSRFPVLRAVLAARRIEDGLCHFGSSALPEVKSTLGLALDLHAKASDEEPTTVHFLGHRVHDMTEAKLHGVAGWSYLVLARGDRRFAGEAQERIQHRITNMSSGYGKNRAITQANLASARFVAGEAEQGCEDGELALNLAQHISSAMIRTRLKELAADAEPYAKIARVRELRERVTASLTNLN